MPEPALAQTPPRHQNAETPVRPGAGLDSFLARQPWFGFKGRPFRIAGVRACIRLSKDADTPCILVVDVEAQGALQSCQLPVTGAASDAGEPCLGWLYAPDGCRPLRDASADTAFWRALARFGQRQGAIPAALPARAVRIFSGEQSNTVAFVDNRCCIKLYRSLGAGPGAETQMLSYLNGAGYRHAPRLLGVIRFGSEPLAAATGMLAGTEDAWSVALRSLREYLARDPASQARGRPPAAPLPELARGIGRRLAEFHRVMGEASGDRLAPVPFAESDATRLLREVTSDLAAARKQHNGELGASVWENGLAALRTLRVPAGGMRIRTHGDLHLGQILVSHGEMFLIDFEGEPGQHPGGSGRRHPALRDLAGMLRSLEYAALAACGPGLGELMPRALHLADLSQEACLAGYREAGAPEYPEWRALLWALMLQRALHELRYERGHRPQWTHLALRGLARLIGRGPSSFIGNP